MWKQTNKLPAWISLTDKANPLEVKATSDEVKALKSIFGHSFAIKRMELDGRHLYMYRAKKGGNVPDVQTDILVKWFFDEGKADACAAYNISRWLYSNGVSTPCPFGEPLDIEFLGCSGVICSLGYMEHRLLDVSLSDLSGLALSLVKLHETLSCHPDISMWEVNTNRRLDKLSRVRSLIANRKSEFGPNPDLLYRLANNLELDFVRNDLPVQCLHGDMNYRNAFVPEKSQDISSLSIMLFDFEDVSHSVLPLVFELALVIERFITVHDVDYIKAANIARGFLDTYANNFTNTPELSEINWLNVIQSLHLRSLCVLSLIESEEVKVPDEEWNKFFYLFDRANKQSEIWNSLY